MTITEAVKSLRLGLGDTQQKFANRLGLAISTAVRYETSRAPSGAALIELARVASEHGLNEEANVLKQAFATENGMGKWGSDMLTRQVWREANAVERPVDDKERMVIAEALFLYRNREHIPGWADKDKKDLEAVESLVARYDHGLPVKTDRQAADDIAAWARLRRAPPLLPSALVSGWNDAPRNVPPPSSTKKRSARKEGDKK